MTIYSLRSMTAVLLALAMCLTLPAAARTKLVALPERAALQFNLENPNAALATEERVLALSKGLNRIDFSWQGVSIDPASIQISMLDNPDSTTVLNVTYPPNENALVWEIFSPASRQERVRIVYLLSGITRQTAYRLVAEQDEKQAQLEVFYSLSNVSGEDLDKAKVVSLWPEVYEKTIKTGETRKIKVLDVASMPIRKIFKLTVFEQSPDAEMKYRPRLFYGFTNDMETGLGTAMLPHGKYRVFQKDPTGSQIFAGENFGKELPVTEKQELLLGNANDVVIRRNVFATDRINVQRNRDNNIVSYDENVTLRYELENFKDEAVTLIVEEMIGDYWEPIDFKGLEVTTERETNDLFRFTVSVPPDTRGDKKKTLDFTYRRINQVGS